MPRNQRLEPAGRKLAEKIAFAQINRFFPIDVVKASLESADKSTKRNRDLPNEFMAYYPALLCLNRNASQQEVLRIMADGLEWLFGLQEFKITGKSGISQARTRIGAEPLRLLFEECAKPLASKDSIGSFHRDLRLVALDGSELDLG